MLGVVTEVTFQCEEAFHLEETLVPHPLHHCIENLEEIIRSSEYTKLWIELFSGKCATLLVNRTRERVRTPWTMFAWDLKVERAPLKFVVQELTNYSMVIGAMRRK